MNVSTSTGQSHSASPRLGPQHLIPVGCLAPWQVKRLESYIESNLAQRLDVETLAKMVNLSSGYLSHAFKRTFGSTVHNYVMLRRIERARQLILDGSAELRTIALTCGMSDQSHLTHWFRRVVGETPAAFRRARFQPPPLPEGGEA